MMKRLVVTALIALSLTTEANAFDSNDIATSYKYESLTSCGKFINKRRSGSNKFHEDWMRGYMTAVNRHVAGRVDFFDGADEEGVLLWIEQWCLKNPTSTFLIGLVEFEKTRGIR